MPSVWEVVSAYLHSGTAAVDAEAEPVRGSSNERVAQVRCLLDKIDADTPKVERGSTREALRQLFAETEVVSRCGDGPGHRPTDLSTAPPPPLATAAPRTDNAALDLRHLPPPPTQPVPPTQTDATPAAVPVERPIQVGEVSDGNGDDVVIDLRDGAAPVEDPVPDRFERVAPGAPEVLRRPIQKYGTVRRDSIDDAVVRWYTMRHGTRPAVARQH